MGVFISRTGIDRSVHAHMCIHERHGILMPKFMCATSHWGQRARCPRGPVQEVRRRGGHGAIFEPEFGRYIREKNREQAAALASSPDFS